MMRGRASRKEREMRLFVFVLLVGSVSGFVSRAGAVPIEFGFTGVVTGGSFVTGTPISGSYVFESTTPGTPPSGTAVGYLDAVLAFSVSVGSTTFTLGPEVGPATNEIDVYNNLATGGGTDIYLVLVPLLSGGGAALRLEADQGVPLLASSALPLTPPDLSLANAAVLELLDTGSDATGQITSLFLVPEPAAGALTALGIVGSVALSRRYDRRSL
jgi:hypothetical protein